LNNSRKPKIALYSPFPPQQSGISHYTARFLPFLSEFADVKIFSSRRIKRFSEYASLFNWSEFEADRRLITMGNSHFHSQGFDLMHFEENTIICHDVTMENLLKAMSIDSPMNPSPDDLELKEIHWQSSKSLDILNGANNNLVFHDPSIVQTLKSQSDQSAYFVPFMSLRDFKKEKLVPRNLVRISLLGEQNFNEKMMDMLPEIGSWLEIMGLKHEFRIVGYLNPILKTELVARFMTAQIQKLPTFTGFIDEAQYRRELANSDIGLQLRRSSYLTLSGAASDLAVFGIRSVVPQSMKTTMQLPDYFFGLPDDVSPYIVARTILESLEYPEHMIESERLRYTELSSPENYVDKLLKILAI
jgi:hypothetical protein